MVSMEALRGIDWTFREVRAREGIHGLHSYPAMMAPPVARTLLENLSRPHDTVLDPFCGSGTVIAEAMRLHRFAIGVDINPLALLIARVKSHPLPMDKLEHAFEQLQEQQFRLRQVEPPHFVNIDYWFKPEVQRQLATLKAAIETLGDERLREFCLVVFSRVVREVSNTRPGEFKLFRRAPEQLRRHCPDVFAVFRERFWECTTVMHQWWEETKDVTVRPQLLLHDMRQPLPLEPESVDIVLTSPPYGDARTTVAYGQFSRLSLQWLGLWQEDLDRLGLGGAPRAFPSPPPMLASALNAIAQRDAKRAKDVMAFYADLKICLHHIAEVVKEGGYIIFVVANRKVKGVVLPTDKVIAELLPELDVVDTFVREIPHKRMPLRNSPSNIPGETDTTMLAEHIVILQKVRPMKASPPKGTDGQLRLLEKQAPYHLTNHETGTIY